MRLRGGGPGASSGGRCLRCPELCFRLVKAETPTPHSPPLLLGLRAPETEPAPAPGQDMPLSCLYTRPLTISSSLQEMVYQATTKSLIEGVISGYNATVFAYGPTGEARPWDRTVCPF